jgi:hypothetical protein
MKVNVGQGTGVKTNTVGTSYACSVGDPAKIIQMLRSGIYAKPIQTLVQEYVSNGRDACREAGHDKPLFITLPTVDKPVWKCRDYGTGITEDRVANVFVQFGISTKTHTDSLTGGFGIGGKIAWAYGDSFVIITYVDGIARHYVAHIGSSGNGQLDLVNTHDTEEPNGTEIAVAVKSGDIQKFRDATLRATYFWATQPTFANDEHVPAWYRGDSLHMWRGSGSLLFRTSDHKVLDLLAGGEMYTYGFLAVVDGIPYHATVDTHNRFVEHARGRFAVFLGNGDVDVATSRESLRDSDKTEAALTRAMTIASKDLTAHMASEMRAPKTLRDFLDAHKSIRKLTRFETSYSFVDSDKTSYDIEPNGGLQSPAFKDVRVIKTSQTRTRNDNVRLELKENNSPQSVDFASMRIVYQDSLVNKAARRRKLVKWLGEVAPAGRAGYYSEQGEACLLLEHDDPTNTAFVSLMSKLHALAMSEIVTEEPKRRKAEADLVGISVYKSGRRTSGITTEYVNIGSPLRSTYVYNVKTDENFKDIREQLSTHSEDFEKFGLKLCFISETVRAKIATHGGFVHWDDLIKNPKAHLPALSWASMEKAIFSNLGFDMLRKVRALIGGKNALMRIASIKDPFLSTQLIRIRQHHNKHLPHVAASLLGQACIAAEPALRIHQDNITRLGQVMKERYPMLSLYSSNYYDDDPDNVAEHVMLDELIWYINAKYAKGGA